MKIRVPVFGTWVFLVLGSGLALIAMPRDEMTADRLIAKCAAAMEVSTKISSLKTLVITVGLEGPLKSMTVEIKRPNLIRKEIGPRTLVFDGRRAAWLGKPAAQGGAPRPPQILDAEDGKDFETDIALFFPAFFDHPAVYGGTETVAGHNAYKLSVALPLGANVTYFIDADAFLVSKAVVTGTRRGTPTRSERKFSGYEKTGGIKYFRSYSYTMNGLEKVSAIQAVKFNETLGDDRFIIPDGTARNE